MSPDTCHFALLSEMRSRDCDKASATLVLLSLMGPTAGLALVLHPARAVRRHEITLQMSWSDPDWKWGSASGKAHDTAQRLRSSLSTPEARSAFIRDVGMMDPQDFKDGKVVLALNIQRAAKRCYAADYGLDSEEQNSWRALMNEMADCQFEGYRGDVLLAEAIGDRLGLIESKRLAAL